MATERVRLEVHAGEHLPPPSASDLLSAAEHLRVAAAQSVSTDKDAGVLLRQTMSDC
jgi:hypothetical protein